MNALFTVDRNLDFLKNKNKRIDIKIRFKYIMPLFLAFYGNLDSKTGFDTETVNITTISNRTDYVKISNQNGNSAYMICDFTQWENLPKNSKRDHCKFLKFLFIGSV